MLTRFRLAAIPDAFRQLTLRLRSEPVYAAPVKKKSLPALTVYRQFDPSKDDDIEGYYYSERAGKDSVAFLLFDANQPKTPWGVLMQWHGPLRRFGIGAYTGSLDKPSLSIEDIVQEEVLEEAGYLVGLDRISYLATEPVSGQSNEETHLFVVDVTGLQAGPLHPENIFEASTERPFWRLAQVLEQGEWKAKVITLVWGLAG